jgi:hypothetical protein
MFRKKLWRAPFGDPCQQQVLTGALLMLPCMDARERLHGKSEYGEL